MYVVRQKRQRSAESSPELPSCVTDIGSSRLANGKGQDVTDAEKWVKPQTHGRGVKNKSSIGESTYPKKELRVESSDC